MTEKLKPCPFCGSPVFFGNFNGRPYVGCLNANCHVIVMTECFDDREAAATVWNRRAGDE